MHEAGPQKKQLRSPSLQTIALLWIGIVWRGMVLWMSISLLQGCLTFSVESGTTPASSTESARQVEPSSSRIFAPAPADLSISLPVWSSMLDISLPVSEEQQVRNQPSLDPGAYPVPRLSEGEDASFPRSEGPAAASLFTPFKEEGGPIETSVSGKALPFLSIPPLPAFPILPSADRAAPTGQESHIAQATQVDQKAQAAQQALAGRSALPADQPKAAPPKDDPKRQVPAKEATRKEPPTKEDPSKQSSPNPRREDPKPSAQKAIESPQAGKPLSTDPLPQKKVEGEVGKTVRIVLPGIGWIYLGEKDRLGKVKYLGKDTGTDSTTFTFTIIQEGDAVLQFQQQDLLAKSTAYDSVLVTTSRNAKHATMERKDGKDVKDGKSLLAPTTGVETVPSASGSELKTTTQIPFPQQVDRLVKEGKKREAVRGIEEYLQSNEGTATQDRDRWYFTLAQMYEREPEVKDIKKALHYYEKVRDQFPFSSYWEEADYRSRYIRRNFFEIR